MEHFKVGDRVAILPHYGDTEWYHSEIMEIVVYDSAYITTKLKNGTMMAYSERTLTKNIGFIRNYKITNLLDTL